MAGSRSPCPTPTTSARFSPPCPGGCGSWGQAEPLQAGFRAKLAHAMDLRSSGTTARASTLEATRDERRGQGPTLLPTLTVLTHPDLHRIGERAFLVDLARGREVSL